MPISAETLKQFAYYKTFIETGCGNGGGIDAALAAGFEEVYSIELYKDKYLPVRTRFANDLRVSLLLGNSTSILTGLLPALSSTPCVFWLDAHYDFAVRGKGNNLEDVQPILGELEAIQKHSRINTHTILIDDRPDFVNPKPWFHSISEQKLKDKMYLINSGYRFRTIDGVDKDTILVAELLELRK